MLAKHAQDYVASLEFEEVCHLAGLKAEDVRLVSPDNAAEAYFRFQHGEYERPESVLEPEPDESALLEREPTVTELVALELEVEV